MPRKPRYLSHNTNSQPLDNETSNNLRSPWFPFTYSLEIDGHQNSCDNVPSGQASGSSSASHDSLLQSKNCGDKRKADALPGPHSILPDNDSTSLKLPMTSEGSMCIENYFSQSKNLPRKRKQPDQGRSDTQKNEIAARHIRQPLEFPDSRYAYAATNGQMGQQDTITSTSNVRNGARWSALSMNNDISNQSSRPAEVSPSTQHNNKQYQANCVPNMQDVPPPCCVTKFTPWCTPETTLLWSKHACRTANCPGSISNVSHHDQLCQNRRPKKSHQKSCQSTRRSTGGTTHNVRRRLRADNSANTFASPPPPDVGGPSVLPTPDSTPSYENLGDCDQRCRHCGAAFWYEERVKRSSTNARTEYHLCCGDGRFGLIHFFDTHNELVQVLRTARDLCNEANIPEFKLRLYNAEGARGYELPTSNTLAAIVFHSGPTSEADYDVIIQYTGS
ncbi:helitron helicase-like domain-containing protein [Artemisia annua]|uniref:Helitron helicase-like domain-containing protein n=1 Tax=Artemisia annua TaxID=35608 RepID=A0A2U1NFS6_ARTAN|nr:helitron helicase-like domain-containing protein [Artemisia annua]